jgi:hypothetical protein
MANKIASILIAVAILAAAFVLIPDPTTSAPPATPAFNEAGDAVVQPTVGGDDIQTPATKGDDRGGVAPVDIVKHGGESVAAACEKVTERLGTLGGDDFERAVGDALHSTMQPQEVSALCSSLVSLEDDALLAKVAELTSLQPPQ